MTPRTRLLLYLGGWAGLAAGAIYLAVASGKPWWFGAACGYLLFYFGNGTLAYVHHARKMREQRVEPPGYLSYLFFGSEGGRSFFTAKVPAPRPLRAALGVVFMLGGGLFLLLGAVMPFGMRWGRLTDALWAFALVATCFTLGGIIAYVGFRLARHEEKSPDQAGL